LACRKRERFEKAEPKTIFEKTSVKLEENPNRSGIVNDGVYRDAQEFFTLEVSDDWIPSLGVLYGGLHLRLEHIAEETAIEVWSFQGIQYKPAPRDECIWSFLDKGLYNEWGFSRSVNVATCHPIDNREMVIFAYLLHKFGRTWQLEAHVSRDNLVEGRRIAEELLQDINWSDVEPDQK